MLLRREELAATDHGGTHMNVDSASAPKIWRGRFFEDIDVGDVYEGRLGKTITETDNQWFTLLTLNTNQMHFNDEYAKGTRFGKPLVNSCFTLSLVAGMTVPDTSENATANLGWTDIKLPNPVFVGDTLGQRRRYWTSASPSHARTWASFRCAAAASTSGGRW